MPKQRVAHSCIDCGKTRTVFLLNGAPQNIRCRPCGVTHWNKTRPAEAKSRENHPRWKGGRHIASNGYVQVVIPLGDPLLPMADKRGRVYEHRLVMARHLGRLLESSEQVHHRNADKVDNRLENLELTSLGEHQAIHHAEIHALRARVRELEHELSRGKATPS